MKQFRSKCAISYWVGQAENKNIQMSITKLSYLKRFTVHVFISISTECTNFEVTKCPECPFAKEIPSYNKLKKSKKNKGRQRLKTENEDG